MATILFYSPFNQRSRDTESLMLGFQRQGNKVISLSQQEGHLINDFLTSNGIEALSYVLPGPRSGSWYFLRHLIYFIRFCRRHQVDIVYSHLEPANFVASIGAYFIRSIVYLCRHHIDEGSLYRFDSDLYYKITYKLAKRIIVVSKHAREYMIRIERIPERKIIHINLAYDFKLYPKPSQSNIKTIRDTFPCDVLLISVCRLTEFKRPDFSIRTLKLLLEKGIDAKLIILGKGEMNERLQVMIRSDTLEQRVHLAGFVSNVLDYIAAGDFFIHPSLLDSSCVAVKEAGLVNKPVIVCKGIGDFEDYIIHGTNGFSVDPTSFDREAADLIAANYKQKEFLRDMGENLNHDVVALFSIEKILPQYAALNKPH